MTREPPGCYQPSRLKFTRSEPGRTTIRKACPPKRPCGRTRVSEVRTKLAHFVGAQTRVVSPSMLAPSGIKRRIFADPRRRQSWTGRPARSRDGLARFYIRNGIGLLPFRAPSRVSKRNKFRSPQVCRDAQRRTDKLGRHARCGSFRASDPLCQVLFRDNPREKAEKEGSVTAAAQKSDDGSTLTPGPMVDEIATRLM